MSGRDNRDTEMSSHENRGAEMNGQNRMYLRAGLEETRFAVPAELVWKILPDPAAVPMPAAPEGICGILYSEGAVYPLRTVVRDRFVPARLAILCQIGTEGAAYAADTVAEMSELTGEEAAHALPVGDAGILLLDKKDQND